MGEGDQVLVFFSSLPDAAECILKMCMKSQIFAAIYYMISYQYGLDLKRGGY